jgi:flagellar biosynthesis anti-sigma factor FlgM
MRIEPDGIKPVGPKRTDGASEAGKAEGASAPEGAAGAEKVASAAEVRAAQEAVGAAADVRLDRVAELRARIERGEFKVDADKIADGIVEGG